jgi:hypothetical protein
MGIFVYGILSKWYIMMMIAIAVVTFWVFKGLEEAGVLDAMEKTVRGGLLEVKAVAQHCTPKIKNLGKMWDCIQNIKGSDYKDTFGYEKQLTDALEKDLKKNKEQTDQWANRKNREYVNPYEQELDEEQQANTK